MQEKVYSLEEFEEALGANYENADALKGAQVDRYGEILTYGIHGLQKMLFCARCGKEPFAAYIGRGAPGWCYVFDEEGHYLADLRNQDYYCNACALVVREMLKGIYKTERVRDA